MAVTKRVALVFPGQGTETPGMGVALAEAFPLFREVLESASVLVGEDLLRLLRRGGRKLGDTALLQPALSAVSLGILACLQEEGLSTSWSWVLGHSLGELGALCAAGAFSSEDTIALAATRGRLMSMQAQAHPGGMCALKHASAQECEQALALGQAQGWLELAAHNGPSLWTLSGEKAAIDAVARAFEVAPVAASGPWHSSRMAAAATPFTDAVTAVLREELRVPWLSNHTGSCITQPTQIPTLLAAQLTHPVQWHACMQTLQTQGVTDLVLCGPGKILQGMLRHNLADACVIHHTEHPRALRRTLDALKGAACAPAEPT